MIPFATQLRTLQGGEWIVAALQSMQDSQNAQPWRVGGIYIRTGSGAPERAVVGSVGDLYLRTDGSTSTTLYVKTSGANTNTGWTAK